MKQALMDSENFLRLPQKPDRFKLQFPKKKTHFEFKNKSKNKFSKLFSNEFWLKILQAFAGIVSIMSLKPAFFRLTNPIRVLFFLLLLGILTSCQLFRSQPGPVINDHIQTPFIHSRIVPVHIASNRSGNGAACNNQSFGNTPGDSVRYFLCPVNVPRKHSVGALDRSNSRHPDPDSYFKVDPLQTLDQSSYHKSIKKQAGDEILLFVHGFNVPFEDAMVRAAQIAYDLKFQGAVALYTWPAGTNSNSLLSHLMIGKTYKLNQKFAARTVPLFAKYLLHLSKNGRRVHVMVHSMGHQVVLPALVQLHNTGNSSFLGEVILNAPDYATQEFRTEANKLKQTARRITLYCSPGDNALVASQKLNGNHRLGMCAKTPGIDVINVNEIDAPALGIGGLGHGYYSGRAILTDIYQVLFGVDVRKRLFIRSSSQNGGEDFILRR